MQTFPKKRVEIIVEAPVLNRVLRFLQDHEVSGYTVMPALAGSGDSGRMWSREGMVGEAGRMVTILMIIDEARLEPLFDQLYAMVSRQIGVIAISDCTVVRDERF
jgi:nitrogen regulatory protein PII